MKRGGGLWIVALVAALFQATFLAAWRPLGVVPDLVLLTIVFIALVADLVPTLLAAVAGGLVLDFAAGEHFGLSSLVFVAASCGVAYLRTLGVVFDFWLSVLAVGVTALFFGVVQLLAVLVTHGSTGGFGSHLVVTVLIDLAVALVLGRPLTSLFRLLNGSTKEALR
jgi:rod shape-determining protein MreD